MPKREPTPPPGDDEPRYLTICYPYPPHANMELPGDRLALARWLACCMGQDDMYAIFHKPSAGNMVIVEIRRDHEGFRKLLGAHKWSEFVRNPGEHHSKVTRIFFSTFPNGRAVEKAGWKRLFVEDSWFNKFSPKNKFIAYPYPLSSYCEVPSEDQTGFTLCRPIPLEMFDIRIPSPPLVPVGSATWVAYKGGPGSVNRKSYALASSASSQVSDFKMPIPLSVKSGLVLGSASPLNRSNNNPYRGLSSVNHTSTGSLSYHSGSPVNSSPCGSSVKGTSNSSSYGTDSPLPEENDSPHASGDGSGLESGDNVVGGYFDASNLEDEFGTTLSLQPTTNKVGKPLCPSHGVICKKGICRDYADLVKRIEREKKKAPGGGLAFNTKDNNFRGRGGGRGSPRGRGIGIPKGTNASNGFKR